MVADYQLGADRDGVDLVEIIHADTGLTGRALIVTAHIDDRLKERAGALNVSVERKPIAAQTLRNFLERCTESDVQAAE